MSIYQSIPKFESTLGGRPVYIPAVLFHFLKPLEVAEQLKGVNQLSDGVCYTLRVTLENSPQGSEMCEVDPIALTYDCIDRALTLRDHEHGGTLQDMYLGTYFWLKQGVHLDSYSKEELMDLRNQWINHIKHHLKEQA